MSYYADQNLYNQKGFTLMEIKATYVVMERYENCDLDIDRDDIICICETKDLAIKKAIRYTEVINEDMTNNYYNGSCPGFTYVPVVKNDFEDGYFKEYFNRGKYEHRSIAVKEYGVFQDCNKDQA